MPNKEGRYGGYSSRQNTKNRTVRTAESGARRGRPADDVRQTGYFDVQSPPTEEEDGWYRPSAEQMQRQKTPVPDRRQAQQRDAKRLARRKQRIMRNRLIAGTVVGVLVMSGIITLLLPKEVKGTAEEEIVVQGTSKLVAPVPYANGTSVSEGGDTTVQAVNWGHIGPIFQNGKDGYTLTPTPEAADNTVLPEFGRVSTSWFADAAFLGDSLTAGLCASEYDIDVGGALVCGYEGISPNTIVNRTTVTNPDRGEEVAIDVLAAAQPAKLYILLGTNALVGTGNDESFLNYYAKMLEDLQAALPNTKLYVQSVLPCTAEKAETYPGLVPERINSINAQILELCRSHDCYYLDIASQFVGEDGFLSTDYAQPDGVHITVSGYNKWISYLCTHVPYSKDNPYQAGSTWYLDDAVKEMLADIP